MKLSIGPLTITAAILWGGGVLFCGVRTSSGPPTAWPSSSWWRQSIRAITPPATSAASWSAGGTRSLTAP